jgi:hypothetical protein
MIPEYIKRFRPKDEVISLVCFQKATRIQSWELDTWDIHKGEILKYDLFGSRYNIPVKRFKFQDTTNSQISKILGDS